MINEKEDKKDEIKKDVNWEELHSTFSSKIGESASFVKDSAYKKVFNLFSCIYKYKKGKFGVTILIVAGLIYELLKHLFCSS